MKMNLGLKLLERFVNVVCWKLPQLSSSFILKELNVLNEYVKRMGHHVGGD